jgi:CubicO group peptidase (beta-lactamase class C family)
VVAGRILEKVTGMPAFSFLQSSILKPLGMKSAIDSEEQPLADSDAASYTRFGLAPVLPVAPEARGWRFAAIVRRRGPDYA